MFNLRLIGLFCLIWVSVGNNNVFAQATADAQIPMDPGVRVGRLSNGFTYYIRRNTVQEKKVVIHLINKVGSILETEKQRGLAHFLEHMGFNGTAHFPKNELVDYLQKSGVRFGADLNAYTSFNVTEYQLPIVLKNREQLHNALQVARDWAQDVTLSDEEIDKERHVIMEEKRLRGGVQQRVQEKTTPMTFNHSLYAARLPIGTEEVILHSDHQELRRFYHDWYRPDLQAIVVVGDIDVNQTEKQVKAMFGNLKMPANPLPRNEVKIPLTGKNQFLAITDPEIKQPGMDIVIKFPGLIVKTTTDYAEDLSRQLLNLMMNDRFNQVMQQANPPFLSGGVNINNLEGGLDVMSGGVTTRPGKLEQGVKAWWREMYRMKAQGFTQSELQRTKDIIATGFDRAFKERDKTGADAFVQQYTSHFLTGAAAPEIGYEVKLAKSVLDTVSVAGINSLLKKYFKDTDRDIVVKSDGKNADVLPAETDITGWIREEESKPMVSYQDRSVNLSVLMEEKPVAGKIVEEKLLPNVGATELKLSNGIRVVLKPTKYKNDQVLFRGYSKGGLSQVSDADYYSASMAAQIVGSGGIGDWSQLELGRWMNRKNVQVGTFISDNYQGIGGTGVPENLEEMMQLIHLYFTRPRRDPVAFANMIQQMRSSMESNASLPQSIFNDTVTAVLGDHHFRKERIPIEKISEINLDKAIEIYRDRFSDAGSFVFTFVGNFNMEKMKQLVALYLGSLPRLDRNEGIKDLNLRYPAGRIARKVFAGQEVKAAVLLAFTGTFDYNVEAARQMDALAKVLTYHLISRIREEEAGVYNISASFNPTQYPSGQYLYTINFVCDPQNAEALILSVNRVIAEMKTDGSSDEDIAKFKAEYRSFMVQAFNENSVWLNYLNDQFQIRGEQADIDVAVDVNARLKAITKENLQQMARKYFNNENYIRVVQLPQTK